MRPHPCNHRNLGTVNDTPTAVLHDPIWKIVNVVRRFWRMCRSTVITAVRTVLLRTCAAREHWRTIGSSQHRVVFSQTCRECQLCSRRNSHNPPPFDGCKASAKLVLWPQTRWTQITATFGKALYELCPESHQRSLVSTAHHCLGKSVQNDCNWACNRFSPWVKVPGAAAYFIISTTRPSRSSLVGGSVKWIIRNVLEPLTPVRTSWNSSLHNNTISRLI
jgi:hypothetical protein